jgi:hypothetical protein
MRKRNTTRKKSKIALTLALSQREGRIRKGINKE